jgi:signal transduction histidine kinase
MQLLIHKGGTKTDLTSKQKEYLNAIKMSGDALIVLINDILDLAK